MGKLVEVEGVWIQALGRGRQVRGGWMRGHCRA